MFQINSDIKKAETIPSEFYTDEKYFELSKKQIFSKTWQFVALKPQINNVKPIDLLPNFLDEPILISKNEKGKINCLSNVCTHRGKILVECEKNIEGIRCGYHGRRFSLDGKFLSMPEFEGVEKFPTEKDNLCQIPNETWNDFIFSSIKPSYPLLNFISEMEKTTNSFDFENLRLISTKDYEVNAHWALYCENYLEGFHIPFVHKSLNEILDFGNYTTETFQLSSLQTGYNGNNEIEAHYFFIFPNMMFNYYPWGLSLNVVKPVKKDLTVISYYTFVNDETKLDTGAGADLETVEMEDQAVVESVQKGINSSFYNKGRYSPNREQGTHHFHRLLTKFLFQD